MIVRCECVEQVESLGLAVIVHADDQMSCGLHMIVRIRAFEHVTLDERPMIEAFCNRFVLGAQRSGTTALRYFLSQHPELLLSSGKEVHFHDRWPAKIPTKTLRRVVHRSRFPMRSGHLVDVTPAYMFQPAALSSLVSTHKAPRGVITLRSPVARAISQWRLEKARGTETLGFSAALERTGDRHWRNHSYIDRGLYAPQVARAQQELGAENLVLLRADVLRSDPNSELDRVWKLFEVGPLTVEAELVHQSKIEFLPGAAVIEQLVGTFEPSIRHLEEFTGWDLSDWLNPALAATL